MFDRILVKFYGFRMSIKTGGQERSGPLTPATGPTESRSAQRGKNASQSHVFGPFWPPAVPVRSEGDLDPAAAPLMKHFPHSQTS